MDALEYSRVIHAEMSAICDAARHGRKIVGSTLYCTTFPCHICSKHIVAAGIKRVVFLEPYPKSLTAELHSDSTRIEGADRGKFEGYPFVEFEHFHGVSPRRYRELFERGKRKDDSGTFVEWKEKNKMPIVDLKFPFYIQLENHVASSTAGFLEPLGISTSELTAIPD
jgi:Cytidine and deoxycytidylate deaminase zinc-binding region